MSTTSTPRWALVKPTPGTNEPADVAVINGNMDKVDAMAPFPLNRGKSCQASRAATLGWGITDGEIYGMVSNIGDNEDPAAYTFVAGTGITLGSYIEVLKAGWYEVWTYAAMSCAGAQTTRHYTKFANYGTDIRLALRTAVAIGGSAPAGRIDMVQTHAVWLPANARVYSRINCATAATTLEVAGMMVTRLDADKT